MKRDPSRFRPALRVRQQGATLVFAALALSVLVILISLADIGFLYYYKREYQKAADLAALAGARNLVSADTGLRSCGGNAEPVARASATQNLGAKAYQMEVDCGHWNPSAALPADRLQLGVDEEVLDAVRVRISGSPPRFLPYVQVVTLAATATALADQPMAQLTLRTSLASISSTQSALLDGVVGGFLGGSVNLTAVGGWQGLLSTDINLLRYLDALALEMGVSAGDYEGVLDTDVGLGVLLDVAIEVLEAGGGTGSVDAAVQGLGALRAVNAPGLGSPLRLGNILAIQTGAPRQALDMGLNLFELVQGGVQLSSEDRVADVNLPVVGLPGVASLTATVKAIEPPQASAVGNPALAATAPYGTDAIFVRSSQVRTLISVDVGGVTDLVSDLTDALSPLLSPLVNFLNSAGYGNLNLLGAVGNLLRDVFEVLLQACNNNCSSRNVLYAEGISQPLQIALDAGGASARVMEYDCAQGEKSLDVRGETAVAHLRVGRMSESDVFSSSAAPLVEPVSLVEIGYRRVRPRSCLVILGIGSCSDEQWEQSNGTWLTNGKGTARKYVISGLGIRMDTPVGSTGSLALGYDSPNLPEVGEAPYYQQISSQAVVGSLEDALADVALQPYSSAANGVLGNLLNGTTALLVNVVAAVQELIGQVANRVLSALVDSLFPLLGVNLATADVGANLSCDGGGATLID